MENKHINFMNVFIIENEQINITFLLFIYLGQYCHCHIEGYC
jgi:hypothetical protein